MRPSHTTRGQSLLELMLAISVCTSVLTLVAASAAASGDGLDTTMSALMAGSSARGCIDAVRSIRDLSYTHLSGGEFAVMYESDTWTLESNIPPESNAARVILEEESPGLLSIICSAEHNRHTRRLTSHIANWRQNDMRQRDIRIDLSEASANLERTTLSGMRVCNDGVQSRHLIALRTAWVSDATLSAVTIDGGAVYGPDAGIPSDEILPLPEIPIPPMSCSTIDTLSWNLPTHNDHIFITMTIDGGAVITRHVYMETL